MGNNETKRTLSLENHAYRNSNEGAIKKKKKSIINL